MDTFPAAKLDMPGICSMQDNLCNPLAKKLKCVKYILNNTTGVTGHAAIAGLKAASTTASDRLRME